MLDINHVQAEFLTGDVQFALEPLNFCLSCVQACLVLPRKCHQSLRVQFVGTAVKG